LGRGVNGDCRSDGRNDEMAAIENWHQAILSGLKRRIEIQAMHALIDEAINCRRSFLKRTLIRKPAIREADHRAAWPSR